MITTAEAEAWSAAMGGRLPLLWDNTPVNDALMASRLRAGPLRGRAPELVPRLGGYLANPMVQAMASIPALLSAAAWLRGEDPVASWRAALGDQWVLAEGCDTGVPLALGRLALAGDPGAASELRAWLEAAAVCESGPWGDEVGPWVEQLQREAAVCLAALDALVADGVEAGAPLLRRADSMGLFRRFARRPHAAAHRDLHRARRWRGCPAPHRFHC